MKKIIIIFLLFTAGISVIICCKKNDDNTQQIQKPAQSVICDGNGTSAFFPLDSGNSWNYNAAFTTTIPHVYVGESTVYNGKTYRLVKDFHSMIMNETYMRLDPTTKNVYRYQSGTEYLEVPANPYLNQKWQGVNSMRTVTNLSASYNAPACNYTGLIEITDTLYTYANKSYYKRGLGLVARVSSGYDKYELISINEYIGKK